MCMQCVELVKKYYPHIPEDQYGNLLMGATGFPFVSIEKLEEQMKELIANTDGTLDAACAYACKKLDEEMERICQSKKAKI